MVTAPTNKPSKSAAVTRSSALRQSNGKANTRQVVQTTITACEICKKDYVPKTDEVHCSASCLVRALALYPVGKGKKRRCPICHKRFNAKHPTQRYDRPECRRRATNAQQTVQRHEAKRAGRDRRGYKTCPTCSAKFKPTHNRQLYCKKSCRPSETTKTTAVRQPDNAETSPGKLCEQCGKSFVGHGNRKYCDECTHSKARQTERAYRKHNPPSDAYAGGDFGDEAFLHRDEAERLRKAGELEASKETERLVTELYAEALKPLGQLALETFVGELGESPLPWRNLPKRIQAAWQSAAMVVRPGTIVLEPPDHILEKVLAMSDAEFDQAVERAFLAIPAGTRRKAPRPSHVENLVTSQRVAEYLAMGEEEVDQLAEDGAIPVVKVGKKGRTLRYKLSAVVAAVEGGGR